MELVPDTTNVVYIDEYPELKKRVWMRRLFQERAGKLVATDLIIFPERPSAQPPTDSQPSLPYPTVLE